MYSSHRCLYFGMVSVGNKHKTGMCFDIQWQKGEYIHMKRFLNTLCLLIWIFWLIYGINCVCTGQMIKPLVFICSTLISIIYYIRSLLED